MNNEEEYDLMMTATFPSGEKVTRVVSEELMADMMKRFPYIGREDVTDDYRKEFTDAVATELFKDVVEKYDEEN